MIYTPKGKLVTPANSDKQQWNTWNGWREKGFAIIKGSKATKCNGENFFHRVQVTDIVNKYDRYLNKIAN